MSATLQFQKGKREGQSLMANDIDPRPRRLIITGIKTRNT